MHPFGLSDKMTISSFHHPISFSVHVLGLVNTKSGLDWPSGGKLPPLAAFSAIIIGQKCAFYENCWTYIICFAIERHSRNFMDCGVVPKCGFCLKNADRQNNRKSLDFIFKGSLTLKGGIRWLSQLKIKKKEEDAIPCVEVPVWKKFYPHVEALSERRITFLV